MGDRTQIGWRVGILLGTGALAQMPASAAAQDAVLPSIHARAPRHVEARPAGMPADEELAAQGATIGIVTINSRPLFDTAGPDENTALFRLANRLHIQTRDATIEGQLLFHGGMPYDGQQLAETGRILRDTRYLRDAWVTPTRFHDGVVDVDVVTQDVWTFNPGLSFGRHGGKNSGGLEFEELNFLGLGTQLGLGYKSGVDRDSKTIFYRDRQLGSSWWDLSTNYSDNSDGRLAQFSLNRSFYALDVRRAGGVSFSDDLRTDSRYDLGEIIDKYQTNERFASGYFGISDGLRNGWVTRLSAGLTYEEHQFKPAPGEAAPRLLPGDRTLAYPWLAVEWVEDDFHTARNRDQIERTEDYALGWRARAQLGFAPLALGSDRDAVMLNAVASDGVALTESQSLTLSAAANARLEHGSVVAGVFTLGARYHLRQTPRRLFFMDLSASAGSHLDVDQQILLGGDNGLRGYPLRYQAGAGRWLFTAEQRWFSDWYPFQMFNVGGAVFYDMGATWGRDPLGTPSQGLLRDVGFGLRLGNSRSALGNVVHIDVAFPLDGDSSIKNLQFVIETKRTF
ncbi:MAG: BamA/TamA family outer membrane protein [Pseudomonadota bacterium]